eukprot:6212639-Pleurochrysis_carterae.AAC.3
MTRLESLPKAHNDALLANNLSDAELPLSCRLWGGACGAHELRFRLPRKYDENHSNVQLAFD